MAALAPVSPRFRAVLEAHRDAWNARFLRGGRGRAPAAFLAYLARTVGPLVDAAGDDHAAAVATALFDLGLAGMGRGLVGEDAPSSFERALVELLPRFAPLFPRDTAGLVRPLGNAWARLDRELGEARARWWMETLAAVAPRCEARPTLLDVGLVLSWRAGLAEARSSALARALALEPAFRTWLFESADLDTSAARRFAPPASKAALGPLAVMARIGGFAGFGGPFAVPPRAFAAGDRLFATDGRTTCEVHADVYGARLCTVSAPPAAQGGEPVKWSPKGRVHWHELDAEIAELEGATSAAAASSMLAVTTADSHVVWVLGRPPGTA